MTRAGTGLVPWRTVTLVTPGFRPLTGGVEAHTSELVAGLTRLGIRVEVLTARRDVKRPVVTECDGYRVLTYPAWRIRSMSISPRLLWAAIRRRRSADLMHVHSYHATTAMALLGSRAPTVFTPHYHGRHGHSTIADILHVGFYRLGRVLLRRSDAVICVSNAEREQLVRDFPFVADRVIVIPNGVQRGAIRTAAPYHDEPPTVLCVSRLEPYKGVADVIRAFAHLPAPTQLVIIGDGSQRAELSTLAGDLGVSDRVRLMGPVSDPVLYRWLRTARVFVSMSEREAFGMAPLEAASAGARVILSDIPAHREIVADYLSECAVLQSGRSPKALAAEIQRQLASGSPVGARIPDWADITARTVGIYTSVSCAAVRGSASPRQLHNHGNG